MNKENDNLQRHKGIYKDELGGLRRANPIWRVRNAFLKDGQSELSGEPRERVEAWVLRGGFGQISTTN